MQRTSLVRLRNLRWLLPVLLAVLFTLGDTVAANSGKLYLGGVTLPIKLVISSALFVALFIVADNALNRLFEPGGVRPLTGPLKKASAFLFDGYKKSSTLKLWTTILICWTPWLIALHPGVFWSDTSQQLLEHYGLATLSDHHPYAMTLLLGAFADLGQALFSSVSRGLFVLIVLQCLVASFYFARFTSRLATIASDSRPALGALAFVSLFPFIPFMFSSLAKDTVSAALFIGVCFNVFCILTSPDNEKITLGQIIELSVLSTGCALTKKTAGYIVVASLLLLMILHLRKKPKRSLCIPFVVTAAVTFVIVPKVVLPAAGVLPGGKQEMIAVAIQQVAHDAVFDEGTLSDEDRNLIDNFLPISYNKLSDCYDWQIVDPIKGRSLKDESLVGEFLQLWAKQTIKNPLGHLEAWLGLVDGWISFRTDLDCTPNYMVVCSYSGWHDEGIEMVTDWNDQQTKGGKAAETIYRTAESIPLLSILFMRSTWATIIPFFALFSLMGKQKGNRLKGLVLLAPLLLSMLTLTIVPVSIMGGEPTRYLFAMVCASPFLLLGVNVIYRKPTRDERRTA